MVAELQFIYQGCHVTILKYKYDFIQLFDNLSISLETSGTLYTLLGYLKLQPKLSSQFKTVAFCFVS